MITFTKILSASVFCLPLLLAAGCSQEEKVVDIETPADNVEVNRDTEDGDVEVNVNSNQ